MNTNFPEEIRSSSFNRKHTTDVTNERYHERSSHGNSSTDDKDDDSNSCPSNYNSVDGFTRHFPLDDDRIATSGDSSYRKRRMKNNEAARKSREKRRRLDAELRRQLELVIAENRSLKQQLKLLRIACGLPTEDETVVPAVGVTPSRTTKYERFPVKKKSSCINNTPSSAPMTSPNVKLEPEVCDGVVSADNDFESAEVGNCDRIPAGIEFQSVHLDPASSDGIGRLLAAAGCESDCTRQRRTMPTSFRLDVDVDVVDWRQTIGVDGGMIDNLQYGNNEPLNLSIDTSVNYDNSHTTSTRTPTRMVCV